MPESLSGHSRDSAVNADPLHKKRKTDNNKTKKEKRPIPNQCEYYMVQKQRRCAMKRKKDRRFCSEHIKFDDTQSALEVKGDRVDCPLDPKHSVWVKDLEAHLKKCNAKPVEKPQEWFERGWNSRLQKDPLEANEEPLETGKEPLKTGKEPLGDVLEQSEKAAYAHYVSLLRKFSESVEPLDEVVKAHAGLENWHEAKENRKHIDQQSSLIGHLHSASLLSPEFFYVEFGCGKAELSRTVNTCILHDMRGHENTTTATAGNYGFGLIDRGVNRMKFDNKIVKDCQLSDTALSPTIKRSRIDIEHLHLDKYLESVSPSKVVGISKHLCGVATDLTLKLILNSKMLDSQFQGLVVAMCCRHACNYQQLLRPSREFLALHGIHNEHDFKFLKTIVPWAVCGSGSENDQSSGANHVSGLEYAEREAIGLAARRLIDESRVHGARALFGPNFAVKLFKYAPRSTTPENSCLHICRNQN